MKFCSEEGCEIVKREVAAATKRLASLPTYSTPLTGCFYGYRAAPLLFDPDSNELQAVFDIEGVISMDEGVAITFYVEVFTDSVETGVIHRRDVLNALIVSVQLSYP